jgi:hypothetical protein
MIRYERELPTSLAVTHVCVATILLAPRPLFWARRRFLLNLDWFAGPVIKPLSNPQQIILVGFYPVSRDAGIFHRRKKSCSRLFISEVPAPDISPDLVSRIPESITEICPASLSMRGHRIKATTNPRINQID